MHDFCTKVSCTDYMLCRFARGHGMGGRGALFGEGEWCRVELVKAGGLGVKKGSGRFGVERIRGAG